MPDNENTNEQAPTSSAPAEDQIVMTKAEFNAAMKASRLEGEEKMKKRIAQPAPAMATASAQAPAESDFMREVQELRRKVEEGEAHRRFSEALAGKPVTREQSARLFKMFQAENPQDAGEWADSVLSTFGIKAQTPGSQVPNTTPATPPRAEPAAAPSSTVPKPLDLSQVNGLVKISALSREDSRDPKRVREFMEHNARVRNAQSGAPTPPRPPQRK